MRNLDTHHDTFRAAFDEDLVELRPVFLVLQLVDGENLFHIGICQGKRFPYIRKLFLELALVTQEEYT